MTRYSARLLVYIVAVMATMSGMIEAVYAAGPVTTLTQNSVTGPAVAIFNGRLYVAWTGTDNPNHLNVASTLDGVNFTAPVIIPNNSSVAWAGPGLAVFGGKLYLSWTGGSSLINYISSPDGVTWSNQVTTAWKAEGSTAMTVKPASGGNPETLYITFADVATNNFVQVYNTTNGVNWNFQGAQTLGGKGSPYSPAILQDPNSAALYVGFASYPVTGVGNAGCPSSWHCIVVNGSQVPDFLNPGVGAPGTTGTGGPGIGAFNGAIYVAWNGALSGTEGTNPHILVATFGTQPMTYFATGQACRGNPALIGWNGHLYLVWTGGNAGRNLNIQWLL
jgi:hypothetical protein